MWNFYSPQKVSFGKGSLLQSVADIKSFRGKKPLVVISQRAQSDETIKDFLGELRKNNMDYKVTNKVAAEAPVELVQELFEDFRIQGCDSIIAIGGGAVLDLAKAVSILPTNGGKIEDYFGLHNVPNPTVPKILVPTTAGTGSEATNIAVLSSKSSKSKKGIVSHHLYADWAIIDPQLTYTVPKETVLATGLDAFCQCLEGFTSKSASPLVDIHALHGMSLISENLALSLDGDENAKDNMCFGAYLSGIAIIGGNSGTNISHAIGNTLGGLYSIPHGLSVTMVLIAGIAFNSEDESYKKRLHDIKNRIDLDVMSFVENIKRNYGIPSLKEAGVKKEDFSAIADKVLKEQQRLLINNRREVTKPDIEMMLENSY